MTRADRRNLILWSSVCLVIGVVAALVMAEPDEPIILRLELTGPPGEKVSGSYTTSDGVHAFEGVLPATIVAVGPKIDYQFQLARAGQLNVNSSSSGWMLPESFNTENLRGGARGHYAATRHWAKAWFSPEP